MDKFNYFTSELHGAPTLPAAVGSLLPVLEMALTTGMGLTVVTSITVSAGVVTIGTPSAPIALNGGLIELTGVPAPLNALNGVHRVDSLGSNSIVTNATVADGSTTAAGMTVKIPPLGWRKAFQDGNVAVYDSPNPQWQGCFLQVQDTAANAAIWRGCGSATSATDVSDVFPTEVQAAAELRKHLSGTGNASWVIFGDDTFVAIGIRAAKAQAAGHLYWAGFFLPRKLGAADVFATTCVIGNNAAGGLIAGMSWTQANAIGTAFSESLVMCAGPTTASGSNSGAAIWLPGVSGADVNSGLIFDLPVLLRSSVTGGGYRGTMAGCRHIPHSGVSSIYAQGQVIGSPGQRKIFMGQVSNINQATINGFFVDIDQWAAL